MFEDLPLLPIRPSISLLEILIYSFAAFLIALILTKPFVQFLHHFKLGKKLRVEAVDGGTASVFLTYHQAKAGTPTMGGLLVWGSILLTVLVSRGLSLQGVVEHSLLQRGQVYIPLAVLVGFGLLGAVDDYLNIRGMGKNKGLNALPKLFALLLMSSLAAGWFYFRLQYSIVVIPFGPLLGLPQTLDLGWLYVPFFIFVVIGTANAVNVTDGLDGLAAGLLIIAFGAFALVAYLSGLFVLAAFCGVVAGALAAFLWHNIPPAIFFMGDTGSLALGGTLAVIAFMINEVLILPLIGFVFVIEMLSVIIQLTSKKLRNGKKVFRSAPFHHHLEALNWGESKVTMRLWIIGAFFAFLGVLVAIYG
ncbi:MAG: phospho-N-acetylmuramoyl-pentapeptide-transferase [Candidatus Peribacteraceae bacterium]|nr:phospho-N-acetylmuramoyl-pentapeptide-transferase [Candidatus Peribacteraceae bacterium]MBP9850532.1 phospho-N-acetylmuramoyl-pentapeptide-transferase [Candidatus Peribacteraceae bacterium]